MTDWITVAILVFILLGMAAAIAFNRRALFGLEPREIERARNSRKNASRRAELAALVDAFADKMFHYGKQIGRSVEKAHGGAGPVEELPVEEGRAAADARVELIDWVQETFGFDRGRLGE